MSEVFGEVDGHDQGNGEFLPDEADDEPLGPKLLDLLDDLTTEFPDVVRRATDSGVTYAVADTVFAQLIGDRADFRLRPEIAEAAARTPEAVVSSLGPEWVTFEPALVDQHALDRAQAWFELGHRLATESHRKRR